MSVRPPDPVRPNSAQPQRDHGTSGARSVAELAERVEQVLQSMAPAWVRTGAREILMGDVADLGPNERASVAMAVPSRRAEFATGRALLRRLIGEDVEIEVGPDRRPCLPVGISGTLAHDRDIAIAATTARPSCVALGVDIEPSTVLDDETAQAICRPEERHLDAHLVFVLKEAAYKAWSSLGGRMLDHRDVTVELEPSDSSFTATILTEGTSLTGRYAVVEDRYVALVVVHETDVFS